MLAGAIHLIIIPAHWAHAPAHGLFFLLVGFLQITWGVAVWRTPSERLYYIGVLMAGWLIVLYGLTRWLPSPFGHGSETISVIDIACKLCELLGMITLAMLIFQGVLIKSKRAFAWRTMALIILLSIISGFATYRVVLAAQPLFPFLTVQVEEHHEEAGNDNHEDGRSHNSTTPIPEDNHDH